MSQPPRMTVDPDAVTLADAGPTCPTERPAAPTVPPLEQEAEAARRAALPDVARRALEEAEARRAAAAGPDLPPELGGRDGPEPVRYGDWELKGIAIDF
jgi:hypothetical protein